MRDKNYWSARYQERQTGWDIGYPSPPLAEYLDQLPDKTLRILLPGAGNAHEAEYAWRQGFRNVFVLDIASEPLAAFAERVPDFPQEQLLHGDFFAHAGRYDLVLEQTFFCALPRTPEMRKAYAEKMNEILTDSGKLVGLWFDVEKLGAPDEPPHGGSREEYLGYFRPYFSTEVFTRATNSIKPRAGKELFGIFAKAS